MIHPSMPLDFYFMDEVVIELIQQIYPHTSLAQMAKTPHFLSTVFHDSNRGAALLRAHAETEHQHPASHE